MCAWNSWTEVQSDKVDDLGLVSSEDCDQSGLSFTVSMERAMVLTPCAHCKVSVSTRCMPRLIQLVDGCMVDFSMGFQVIIEPRREKTNKLDSDKVWHTPGCTYTGDDFVFRKNRYCAIQVAKTKALISLAVTAKMICIFVFAYVNRWFSHAGAQFVLFILL